MSDTVSQERRSEIMSHIKGKNTSIELLVRKQLFALGYRYRINYTKLPGKPDIVFTKKKVVILFTAVFGTVTILDAAIHMFPNRVQNIGMKRLSVPKNGIQSILTSLLITDGMFLRFGNAKFARIYEVSLSRL